MKTIGLSYTPQGGSAYNFILDNFGGNEMPRIYESSATFTRSVNGANLMGGPAVTQKSQWVISSMMPEQSAFELDAMFRSWDADRALGLPAAIGITDRTFGPEISANAVFITPPTYTYISPTLTLVSFGLQEI